MLDTKTEKLLMSKLRQPIHYNYISKYILRTTENVCMNILDSLVKQGKIKESKFSGYYQIV
jgi:hypothetical protein